jgi:hypothetical protein
VKTLFWNVIKALVAFAFTRPSLTGAQSVGRIAGNGGWGDEDADHLKPGK